MEMHQQEHMERILYKQVKQNRKTERVTAEHKKSYPLLLPMQGFRAYVPPYSG